MHARAHTVIFKKECQAQGRGSIQAQGRGSIRHPDLFSYKSSILLLIHILLPDLQEHVLKSQFPQASFPRVHTPARWCPSHKPPSPSPHTCTMVSRFCRDVETELMTEEGPMVTTLMWWEEGGAGAGTITVGWWVGAGGGRSCKTQVLSFPTGSSPNFLTHRVSASLDFKCPPPSPCDKGLVSSMAVLEGRNLC